MAEMQATIPVLGMSCASCARIVERALSDLPGVWSVTVDAAGGGASVIYDPVVLDVSDLAAAVSAAGY